MSLHLNRYTIYWNVYKLSDTISSTNKKALCLLIQFNRYTIYCNIYKLSDSISSTNQKYIIYICVLKTLLNIIWRECDKVVVWVVRPAYLLSDKVTTGVWHTICCYVQIRIASVTFTLQVYLTPWVCCSQFLFQLQLQ